MRLKKVGENVLQWLFVNYLRWIERTVTIRWDEENRYGTVRYSDSGMKTASL